MGSTGMTLAVLEYWRLLLSCLIIVSTNVGFMMIFSDTFGWGAVTYKALSFEFWITRAPLPRTRSARSAALRPSLVLPTASRSKAAL